MTCRESPSEWTGLKGRIGAWYLASPLRRLAELLILGNLRPRFMEALDLQGSERVVDAGCGSGFYSLAVAEQPENGLITCFDLSNEMVNRLRLRIGRKRLDQRVDVRMGDVTALDFPDESADYAISNSVWHELPEPERACRELFRILKPDGRIVVSDFRSTSLGIRIGAAHRQGDHGPFSVKEMTELLHDTGFVDVYCEAVRNWVIAWGRKQEDEGESL